MVQLTDNEKNLIRSGNPYLKDNNIKKFYSYLANNARGDEMGHISHFFIENGINILDYFTSIPNYAFCGADIESIAIPDNITRIGKGAFKDCKKLKNIDLGNSVKSLDAEAFMGCTGLSRVFLPDSLTILGANAFADCNNNLILFADKRTPANRLRCKQNETSWYRDHLFVNEENTEEENI